MSVEYDAFILGDTVYLYALGENPESGWKNYFHKTIHSVYPPEFTFIQEPPSGFTLQVITPFVGFTWFVTDISNQPTSVNVTDEDGTHNVAIRTTISVAERAQIEKGVISRALLPKNFRLGGGGGRTVLDTYYERSLGSYDDLLSQHCSTECSRIDEIDHTGIKVCSEYRTVCQHIRQYAVLIIQVGSAQQISQAVEDSLETATVAAAIAAFLAAFCTAGAGAAAAAQATFTSVLLTELEKNLADIILVRVDFRNEWV